MISQSRASSYTRPLLAIILILGTYLLVFKSKSATTHNGNIELASPVDDLQFHKLDHKHPSKINYFDKSMNNQQVFREVDASFLSDMDKHVKKCPDYVTYSQRRHPPFSLGPQRYPYMRPAPKCRTFVLSAVESVIEDLKHKISDPDLVRLVENCLPNTLDTTILWHRREQQGDDKPHKQQKQNQKQTQKQKQKRDRNSLTFPQSFVVTGDIHAEWLRDAARQLSVYQPFIKYDQNLKELILGAINTQAYFVNNSPYCNAFHPPPGANVKRGDTAFDSVQPRPDWRQVFECKYEIDSLASFLTLTNEYYEHSGGDLSFLNDAWIRAYEKLIIVLRRENEPSFDEKTGQVLPFYYSFQRQTNIGSETLPLGGVGNPVNFGTGLIRSAFRPSDDATVLQFFIPGNIHMLTELKRTRDNILNKRSQEILVPDLKVAIEVLGEKTDEFIDQLSRGIEQFGIVEHPRYGKVYAYEVDGYGSATFMDDANIPSLLAIPDMGYSSINDPVYQNTRKMILEKQGNPYYLKGLYFEGIGGPHIGIKNAWPMSLLVRIRTTNDDDEIIKSLKLVMNNTAGLGLMHESVNVNSVDGDDFTRSWFAWCNSEFGKTILHLAREKPHLIFKEEWKNMPYNIDEVLSKAN